MDSKRYKYSLNFCSQVQASVRKLADSIQTVKTVLGMKIQSEQKLVSIFVLMYASLIVFIENELLIIKITSLLN